jgi:tetratricopeptide (TPR) repeat protein
MVTCLTYWEMTLLRSEETLAEPVVAAAPDASAEAKLAAAKAEADIEAARKAMGARPADEAPVRNMIDALARAGGKRDALAEADRFASHGSATAALRAQRGYLRRELGDVPGAVEDFTEALKGKELSAEQRRNTQEALVEAQTAEAHGKLDHAQSELARGEFVNAADEARLILKSNPNSELAMHIRVAALTGAGRKREALAEADQFTRRAAVDPLLRAQRGFLRRGLDDPRGAAEDFVAALAGRGLAPEQRRNLEAGLAEARTVEAQNELDRAEAALKQGDYNAALEVSGTALQRDASSEAAMRIRIEALSRAGRKREAVAEADGFIARKPASALLQAQRGFLRRELQDRVGAIEDFTSALAGDGLSPEQRQNVQAALAEAEIAERQSHLARTAQNRSSAKAASVAKNPSQPKPSFEAAPQGEAVQAEDWFKLGYQLLQQKRLPQGAEALNEGLKIRPASPAYLDAANAYVFTNAPLASKLYREGLNRWYAGDPDLARRPEAEHERVKNEVVEADASIRTTVASGVIAGRPETAGGTNISAGAETAVRFDGRYLPAVVGLEAVARGLSGKDANGARETVAGIGLRYRPLRDLNLYFGGVVDHFFQPNSKTELVLNWGLGLGANPYPYSGGWKPHWDFATVGGWRTAEGRLLEDTRANAGFLYEFRAPVRAAVGPTLLAVAGYDNKATIPLAAGIGPSVLSYVWLGGDKYRSYDAVLGLQFGYLFNVGKDERQRGWRGQIGVTF